MSDVYGSDISSFAGIGGALGVDPLMPLISGPRVVLEDVARRFMTVRGSIPNAPDFGFDLISLAGKRMNAVQIERLRSEIENEAEKDQRVLSAKVVEFVETGRTSFRMGLSLKLASGPFTLTLAVADVTLTILQAG